MDGYKTKAGLTPRQQLATCCMQHFLVMTGNITKKCCRQHIANCCLDVRRPLTEDKNLSIFMAEKNVFGEGDVTDVYDHKRVYCKIKREL
jgi:hypothetical protein